MVEEKVGGAITARTHLGFGLMGLGISPVAGFVVNRDSALRLPSARGLNVTDG
jgi:hypothetical protein